MVLKKMLSMLKSKGELMGGSEKPSLDNSSKIQQDGSHCGGETKKKMKKVRSVRVADLHGLKKASKRHGHVSLPAPKAMDEAPNYMKPTSSYDAKKGKHTVNIHSAAIALVKSSSLKLWSSSTKKKKNTGQQASSSSTVKSVDLKQHRDGCSALMACDYTYCSIHGHKHASVPTLKRLSSRKRQLLKAQNSIKLRVFSKAKKNGNKEEIELVEDAVNELFSGLQEFCSVSDHEEDREAFNSELSMEDTQVISQFLESIEKGCQEEKKANLSTIVQSRCGNSSKTASHRACFPSQTEISSGKGFLEEPHSIENDDYVHTTQQSTAKAKCSKLRRQITKLRANLERSEHINLKHQVVNDRKEAEEWMVDYALRKALRRMASGRKTKVPLLVSAFEAVMPQMCETKQGN